MKNKKGFTLIELLAVIIILGILMIIAIPSVTKYINDSRKSAYIDTAKEIIAGTRSVVNEGKLRMYDTNSTYFIPSACIKTENALKSPYGDFLKAYVGVIYDGKGYKYYWISVDETGQGIPKITPLDKLDPDDIKSDLKESDIEDVVITTGIGNRSEIQILDCDTNGWERHYYLDDTSNNASEENGGGSGIGNSGNVVVYPEGKTKSTVETGDIVTIDNQQFYVMKHDGANLVMLSKYNLKVGRTITYSGNPYNYSVVSNRLLTSEDEGYGIQSSDAKGAVNGAPTWTCTGMIAFSSRSYWNDEGANYSGDYPYVYDSNANTYQYIVNYKNYLTSLGVNVKEARMMKFEEAIELGCVKSSSTNCNDAYPFVYETSYWLGSIGSTSKPWYITTSRIFTCNNSSTQDNVLGIRPVIVI